jgi:hypothetical protein
MKNPRAVAKRIADFHNDNVKRSVKEASAVEEEVIRRVEDAVEDAYERTTEESMEFNRKLLVIAHANVNAYLEWFHEILFVNSPSEFIAVSMKHCERQLETYREQTRELAVLAQKATIENMGPLGTFFGGALIGRPDLS